MSSKAAGVGHRDRKQAEKSYTKAVSSEMLTEEDVVKKAESKQQEVSIVGHEAQQ